MDGSDRVCQNEIGIEGHKVRSSMTRSEIIFSTKNADGWGAQAPIERLRHPIFALAHMRQYLGGVRQDWEDWNRCVGSVRFVRFHDARVFFGCWPQAHSVPVCLIAAIFHNGVSLNLKIVDAVHSLVVVERQS
jgi:hypothetical protein